MERLAGRIILLWGWRRLLVAFAAGLFAVLIQAPYDFLAAGFVSFPILIWLLDGASAAANAGPLRRLLPAFGVGWWFGFGYFLAGLWWIGGALLVEADSFAWALPFAVLGIPLMLAFFHAVAAALARAFWSNGVGRIFALAGAFGLMEWLRGIVFTGFPWNAVGYGAMPVPLLMQSAWVVGLAGMNALAVLVFAMPALLAGGNGRRLGFSVAIVLIILHAGFGYARLALLPQPAADRSLAVRIVQPNVDLSEKWDEAVRDRIFASMLDLSRKPTAEGAKPPALILWPETSVPFLFTDRPDGLAAIGELLADGQTLVAGAVRAEGGAGGATEPRYYNSVVAINDKGEIVDAVDKVHLVPFGEYLPFADLLSRVGIGRFVAGPTMFSAGSERHAIALPGKVRGLPFVCYEIIFPALVASGAGATDLLINVTNDAWFGDTPGPYQHFRQAQLRTVETGLPLIRAANTGISGVVDRFGRVRDALAMNVAGVVDYDVPIGKPAMQLAMGPTLNGLSVVAFLSLLGIASSYRRPIRTRSR